MTVASRVDEVKPDGYDPDEAFEYGLEALLAGMQVKQPMKAAS